MIISRSKYNQLRQDILDRMSDLVRANKEIERLKSVHAEVIEERNQVGALLLDCLAWMQSVSVTTKQRGGSALIAERSTLVEQARVMGYLPRQEEKEEESGV